MGKRSIGVSLSFSGSSGRQVSETRISKGPSVTGTDLAGGRRSSRKGESLPSYTSQGPWTILGSSGHTGLSTKNAYPETCVRVLPHWVPIVYLTLYTYNIHGQLHKPFLQVAYVGVNDMQRSLLTICSCHSNMTYFV